MLANPGREGVLLELTGCETQHGTNCVHLLDNQFVPVEGKEETDGEKSSPFIAVVKRVIFGQAETVRSRERENVGCTFIGNPVSRAVGGCYQQRLDSYTGYAAMFCKGSGMEPQRCAPI